MSALPPIPSDVVVFTGPIVIANLVNWGLFGILCTQIYYYHLSFPKDPWYHKLIVSFTLVIEVVQVATSTRDAFRTLGSEWGNMIELDKVGWLWFSSPVMGAIIELNAQLFYAWRIWLLSFRQNYIVPAIVCMISISQFVASVIAGAESGKNGHFSQMQEHYYKIVAVWLSCSVACDVIVAASMGYYLRQSRTGFKRTDATLTKLFRITVETGLICAVIAVADFVLFLRFEYNNYHIPLCMALSKLYANGLLMVFNSRMKIVDGRDQWEDENTINVIASNIAAPCDSGPQTSKLPRRSTFETFSAAQDDKITFASSSFC